MAQFKPQPNEVLRFLGNCPVCSRKYRLRDTKIIRQEGDSVVVHADCSECLSSAMFTIVSSSMGLITTVGMMTDLTKQDVESLDHASTVSADDVLRLHNYLEKKK